MTHYILITTEDEREQVLAYSEAEMDEIYTDTERLELHTGIAIFKAGKFHCDMMAAARAVTVDALING